MDNGAFLAAGILAGNKSVNTGGPSDNKLFRSNTVIHVGSTGVKKNPSPTPKETND